MNTTFIEPRNTVATIGTPEPKKVSRARVYIVGNDRIAIELEDADRTYRLECSDVDARDLARLIKQTVEQL